MIIVQAVIMIVCLAFSTAYAAMPVNPSYVSPTGSGASCTAESPCALSYANTNAAAGDTVNLRGGTYALVGALAAGINPSNSGSAGNPITFQAYTGETPIISGDGSSDQSGFVILGKDYITITGITFKDQFRPGRIYDGADHNIVSYCTLYHSAAGQYASFIGLYIGDSSGTGDPSTHNWIHHNTFHTMGSNACDEGYDLIRVGSNSAGDNDSNFNTIEDNFFYSAGHTLTDDFCSYNVWRNNVGYNYGWKTDPGGCRYNVDPAGNNPSNGKYGHRSFALESATGYNLFEGNRAGYASINPANNGADNLTLSSPNNIVRYSSFYGGDGPGIYFKNGAASANNRVYNNTIYKNGQYSGAQDGSAPVIKTGLQFTLNGTGNQVKNNIIRENGSGDWSCSGTGCAKEDQTWSTNICDATDAALGCTAGDPSFVNADITDMTSTVLPNLIPAAAGVIDQGTYLTTVHADDAGSGTTLILTDALYFQAGSAAATTPMGSSLSSVAGDVILVGANIGAALEMTITDINYATNTVTISADVARSDGDKVWLKKKSDGVTVLNGSGPDIGAYETGASAFTVTPSTSTGCTVTPSGAVSVNSGATTAFTMTAAYGYSITATGCTLSGSTCTTAGVTGNLSVVCNPKPHFATLTGSGSVTLGGSGTAPLGS